MTTQRPVLVVDFGAQYAQLIARRIREAQVYSEVVPNTITVAELVDRDPAAVVLSGGPASVYAPDAPKFDPALFDAGVPVLGICYGFQLMAAALGGTVARTGDREYGRTEVTVQGSGGVLHADLPAKHPVWMSHGDSVTEAPPGFVVTAGSEGAPVAAFENVDRRLAGVQYHPEVAHSPHGQEVLRRFLRGIAGIGPDWTTSSIVADQVAAIRAQVGSGRAICGLSGGVDSAVAAALVQHAIGDRLTCVFVDHGLLRAGERAQVERDFVAATGVRLVTVDERQRFLEALAGVSDPEAKRKIIGREFIRAFERAARDLQAEAGAQGERYDFLVQGTLYPDVVESGGGTGAANIKSHHNVGGLPEDLQFKLVEPLRTLFKDEVRRVGLELGLPETIVHRQPFPGPGLAIRILGDITAEKVRILQEVDAVFIDNLKSSGLYKEVWQAGAIFLPVQSVGVMGDERTYENAVALRAVTSTDGMTADWCHLPYEFLGKVSNEIINKVKGINRVVYDISSKPPATIEWE